MEYYSAIKRNELRICITWMYLKGIVPSEKFQSQNLICIIIIIKMSINKKLMHIIFMYFHKQLCEEGSYLEPRGLAVLCPFCGKWLRLKQWFWGLDCLSKKKKDNILYAPIYIIFLKWQRLRTDWRLPGTRGKERREVTVKKGNTKESWVDGSVLTVV